MRILEKQEVVKKALDLATRQMEGATGLLEIAIQRGEPIDRKLIASVCLAANKMERHIETLDRLFAGEICYSRNSRPQGQ